jgi:hypothetical protein
MSNEVALPVLEAQTSCNGRHGVDLDPGNYRGPSVVGAVQFR